MAESVGTRTGADQRPNPDPTSLTTEQMLRETQNLRELLEARLDGMEHTLARLQRDLDLLPTQRSEAIESLQKLHEEKFRSIQTQFIERDIRVETTAKDSKVAVDAALSAAKEAVTEQNKSTAQAIAKSETAFLKQLDQLVLLLDTKTGSLVTQVNDLKDQQTRNEGRSTGANALWGLIVGGIGIVALLVTLGFNIMR